MSSLQLSPYAYYTTLAPCGLYKWYPEIHVITHGWLKHAYCMYGNNDNTIIHFELGLVNVHKSTNNDDSRNVFLSKEIKLLLTLSLLTGYKMYPGVEYS
jgi:hypothetical protein